MSVELEDLTDSMTVESDDEIVKVRYFGSDDDNEYMKIAVTRELLESETLDQVAFELIEQAEAE
jgi:hypothetical protein